MPCCAPYPSVRSPHQRWKGNNRSLGTLRRVHTAKTFIRLYVPACLTVARATGLPRLRGCPCFNLRCLCHRGALREPGSLQQPLPTTSPNHHLPQPLSPCACSCEHFLPVPSAASFPCPWPVPQFSLPSLSPLASFPSPPSDRLPLKLIFVQRRPFSSQFTHRYFAVTACQQTLATETCGDSTSDHRARP